MKRLPKATTEFGKLTDAKLIFAAQSLFNGLLNNEDIYPNPPLSLGDLQGAIDNFRQLSANAIKGTKEQTAVKNEAKQQLIAYIKAEITYINEIVYLEFQVQPSQRFFHERAMIFASGAQPEKIVGRPNTLGNIRTPITISSIAKKSGESGENINGVLKITVKLPVKFQKQAIKNWWIQYRLKVTPAGEWKNYNSTSTRIQVTNLDPGTYQYRVTGVPGIFLGKNQLNWSPIQETVVT